MGWFGKQSQPTQEKIFNAATYLSVSSMMRYRHDAKQLALAKKASVHSKQPSGHRTKLKGRGIDFDEVRRYQPGDDIRSMNWRVMAKTGNPHTKLFHDERERPVVLGVDFSPTMFFATKQAFKSVIASKIASLLAWSAFHHGDRLGGLVFSAHQHWEIRPRRHQNTILRFLTILDEAQKKAHWHVSDDMKSIDNGLTKLRRITRSGSLIFLLSDFRNKTPQTKTHLERLAKHNDIILFHIFDGVEERLPPPGQYRVSDGQTQQLIDTTNEKKRHEYEQWFLNHTQALKSMCWHDGMHYVPISTQQDIMVTLQRCEVCSPFINVK